MINSSLPLVIIAIIIVISTIHLESYNSLAFSQVLQNENKQDLFLLKARIIVKDSKTEKIEVKLKSQNAIQEQFYDKSIDDNSQTLLKFRLNEVFNTPYEICAESLQEKYVYACKGGILYDLKPNVTLTL